MMRRLRYAGWSLVHEVKYELLMLGYRLRPYDSHLDQRRWRWERSGCMRSRMAWRQHPELARALAEVVERDGVVTADRPRCARPGVAHTFCANNPLNAGRLAEDWVCGSCRERVQSDPGGRA